MIEPSSGGMASFMTADPFVVGMLATSILSLSRTGMPCSGPRGPFSARSLSRAAASAFAFGFI